MDWDDLRVVLAVARAGSLSAAARALGVNHSTLSRRLGAFERAAGVPLFVRDRDGVRPDRHGEELLAFAAKAEEQILALERRRDALRGDVAGTVCVATSGILGKGLLAPHLPTLLRDRPQIQLELAISRPLVGLARREADVALRLRPRGSKIAEPSIIAMRVANVAWAVYRSKKRARGASLEGPWVRYRGFEPGADWMSRHRLGADVALAVDEVPTALEAAKSGVGLAVLPCFLVGPNDGLVRVASGVDEHRLVIAVHDDLRRIPRIDAVISWLKDVAVRERARLAGS